MHQNGSKRLSSKKLRAVVIVATVIVANETKLENQYVKDAIVYTVWGQHSSKL